MRFCCKFVFISYFWLLKIWILWKQKGSNEEHERSGKWEFLAAAEVLFWFQFSSLPDIFSTKTFRFLSREKKNTVLCVKPKLVSFSIFGRYIVVSVKTIISWFCEIEADLNDQPILPFSLTKWSNIIYGGRWWDFQDIKLRFMSGASINLTTPLFGQFSEFLSNFLNISSLSSSHQTIPVQWKVLFAICVKEQFPIHWYGGNCKWIPWEYSELNHMDDLKLDQQC